MKKSSSESDSSGSSKSLNTANTAPAATFWTRTLVGTAAFTAAAVMVGGIGAIAFNNTAPAAASQHTAALASNASPAAASAAVLKQASLSQEQSAKFVNLVMTAPGNPTAAVTSAYAKFEMPADFVPNSADGSTENAPFSRINLPAISNGQQAITALGADLPAVAQWYGMNAATFTQLLLADSSVHVDRKGRVLNIDAGVGANTVVNKQQFEAAPTAFAGQVTADGDKATATVAATTGAPFPVTETFTLHSRSKSSRILFLNFKGEGSKPAFDLDKNVGTFSTAELQMIQKIWLRVAEDYSAFDVDVTTETPTSVTGKTGVTILITNQTSDAGGYAYLNSFSAFKLNPAPAFCFQNNLANAEKPIAECVSHELGHTLGLNHQSTASTAYYGGAGDGETGWAPIMGVSYYKNLTQFSKGEFNGATNKNDAYAIMAKQGLMPRPDDVGNTRATAVGMMRKEANGLANLSVDGVIETPTDVDVFSFTAAIGDVSFQALPSAYSGNVDVELRLEDSAGKLIATANTPDKLGATLTAKLAAAGTYYLSVKGAGKGDPATTGYSNYGSIGQYSITGTAALTPPAPPKAPVALIKTNVISGTGPLSITFDASSSTASGSTITKYEWKFGDGTAAATTSLAKYTYAKAGVYSAYLRVTNATGQTAESKVTITVTAPPPAKK